MRLRNSKAFTIVEIVVVITIIAILSSLAVITFNSVRQDSRDATRQSNATIISEALEKYYEEHGEYPSVASIVNSQPANTGPAIASKLAIPEGSLKMPNMPSSASNGIAAGSEPLNNYLVYEASSADDNASCQNDANAGCDRFALRYLEESSEAVKTIESRRSSRSTGAAPEIAVSASSTTTIDATWTSIPGATSYTLQRSLSDDMSSPVTSSYTTTTATATGLTPLTEYFFRVQAILPSGLSGWSEVESATTSTVPAPTGTITISATMSGTNARGTAGGGTCSSGTIERQIRYRVNAGSWQSWTTGSPRDIAATEGYKYTFQAQARCKVSGIGGPWSQSGTAEVTRTVSTPTGTLSIAAAMSGSTARGTASGGSCATGTTIQRQIRYNGTSTSTAGTWSSYTSGTPRDVTANQGWKYTFEQQARCVGTNANSAWVSSGQSSTVRPISARMSQVTTSVSTSGSTTTFTASLNSICPTGTTAYYVYRNITSPGNTYPASWTIGNPNYNNPPHNWNTPGSTSRSMTWNTSATNTKYWIHYQSYCRSTHTSGPWGEAHPGHPELEGEGSYYRP